jgi:hypothetical protein
MKKFIALVMTVMMVRSDLVFRSIRPKDQMEGTLRAFERSFCLKAKDSKRIFRMEEFVNGDDSWYAGSKVVSACDGTSGDDFSSMFASRLLALASADHSINHAKYENEVKTSHLGSKRDPFAVTMEYSIKKHFYAQIKVMTELLSSLEVIKITPIQAEEKKPPGLPQQKEEVKKMEEEEKEENE